jgi:acyl-phosphate glycerol 3-phosphate acyltransferase
MPSTADFLNAHGALLWLASYLVGSIPFGYLVGRWKGIDIRRTGSGNIGATNVSRTLGRGYGWLVFVLDTAKGAAPVVAGKMAGLPLGVCTMMGMAAFVGHIFPAYLGFRGGKGVASGLGVILGLVPGPGLIAFVTWVAVASAFRYVSLASVIGVTALVAIRFAVTDAPFGGDQVIVTVFILLGAGTVVMRHRENLARLARGTENRLEEKADLIALNKAIHVMALGLWFGGAVFFNFVSAPAIFDSFKQVVAAAPSDRTAGLPLVPDGLSADERAAKEKDLASALAGAAVGPIFPKFFLMQAVCGMLVVITALGYSRRPGAGRVDRVRFALALAAWVTVLIGWPISAHVSELRVERFAADPAVAEAARSAFVAWHLVSLFLSMVTALLATATIALAGQLPSWQPDAKSGPATAAA